jgi:hypothetical protein
LAALPSFCQEVQQELLELLRRLQMWDMPDLGDIYQPAIRDVLGDRLETL